MIFLSFLVFFALYAGAAFPTFGSSEAAELLAAAAAGGVPPPPAQSLAWLLAKTALWFPFGNPAYRTNLVAAALMAGTVPLMAGFLGRLSPPKSWAPVAHQELEQDRWRATAGWLTAFIWGLSPGPWRCALSLGADTAGLFLCVCAFAAATEAGALARVVFLAFLAVGQWPVAICAMPGLALTAFAIRGRALSPLRAKGAFQLLAAAALGLAPAFIPFLMSRVGPPLDAGGPDHWRAWLRYVSERPPFFPPARVVPVREVLKEVFLSMGAVYTWPGAALCAFGFSRMARGRWSLFQAALAASILPPALFLWARPAADPSSAAQAAAWGLCALGLGVPFLWGFHRTGVKWPAARTALAFLLPLSLLGRLPLAARGDLSARDRGENVLASLPEGSLLWDPAAPGPVFHAQFVDGRRRDLRVARRPDKPWGRAEYRRRNPAPGRPPALMMSPDLFFLETSWEAGPERVFADDPRRLPEVDPATGLASEGRYPEDAIPMGAAYQFLPSESHKLVDPAGQLSVARVPLWGLRTGDPAGLARSRMDLSRKLDQYGLASAAEDEALAALALDPGQPDARMRLGEAALNRGDAARALVHFRSALLRAPARFDVRHLSGRASRLTGDKPAAAAAFRAGLSLDPSREDARRELAETLEELDRWSAAAQEWRMLMDRNPREPAYPWRLAKAEAAARRPGKAKAALREYLMFPLSDAEKEEAESFEKSLGGGK